MLSSGEILPYKDRLRSERGGPVWMMAWLARLLPLQRLHSTRFSNSVPNGTHFGICLRRLALPRSVKQWSLTTLRDKLIKIGAKVVSSARYITFQMAELAVPKYLSTAILRRIWRLMLPLPAPG